MIREFLDRPDMYSTGDSRLTQSSMRYVFKHEYRQNHSTLLGIIDLLFTWVWNTECGDSPPDVRVRGKPKTVVVSDQLENKSDTSGYMNN